MKIQYYPGPASPGETGKPEIPSSYEREHIGGPAFFSDIYNAEFSRVKVPFNYVTPLKTSCFHCFPSIYQNCAVVYNQLTMNIDQDQALVSMHESHIEGLLISVNHTSFVIKIKRVHVGSTVTVLTFDLRSF